MEEYIICAANHYDDGKIYTFKPKNIESGYVVCGRRHHNCIQTFAQIVGFPYSDEAHKIHNTEVQGFLTSKDRFVGREEAAQIAFDYGQIKQHKITLYSEDLY